MATPKQVKLIKLLMENYGATKNTKSLGKLMIIAGYSQESAKNPKLFMESETIKQGIESFLNQLDDKRRRAITHITEKKLKNARVGELAGLIDTFTKNHQLLSGGSTENILVKPIYGGLSGYNSNKEDISIKEEN